jgi:hypothetical protein
LNDDCVGAGATPWTMMKELSPLEVAVFKPMATVRTSKAMETDASMRDIECLRGIGKTPKELYMLSQQCQACFQTVPTCPFRLSLGFRLAWGATDICDQGQDTGWILSEQRYGSTRTFNGAVENPGN